jgi:hypothetical protein
MEQKKKKILIICSIVATVGFYVLSSFAVGLFLLFFDTRSAAPDGKVVYPKHQLDPLETDPNDPRITESGGFDFGVGTNSTD